MRDLLRNSECLSDEWEVFKGECTGFLCCDTNNSLPKSCVPRNCTPPPIQETCNTCQTCNDSCLSCSCITCETCVC